MDKLGNRLWLSFFALSLGVAFSQGKEYARSFELRYYTADAAANGETDFKGETAVFDTEQRIAFLRKYGEYARAFFDDPRLDTQVATDQEVSDFLQHLKPQPRPTVRRRIIPKTWKWLGYKPGKQQARNAALAAWEDIDRASVTNGTLVFNQPVELNQTIAIQDWRFSMQWDMQILNPDSSVSISLRNADNSGITVGVDQSRRFFYLSDDGVHDLFKCQSGASYTLKLEVDLANNRYNFYVNDDLQADFVLLQNESIKRIDNYSVKTSGGVSFDNILAVGFAPINEENAPFFHTQHPYIYMPNTFMDEDFKTCPSIENWQQLAYDESLWQTTALPKVHGGERFAGENLYISNQNWQELDDDVWQTNALPKVYRGERFVGEDLYLRRVVEVGDFQRAQLNIEVLDPGGEIWINGQVVEVVKHRYPVKLDVSEYLIPNAANLIALKVNAAVQRYPVEHGPADLNIGWFVGRVSLDLTADIYIDEVLLNALDAGNPASMRHRIKMINQINRSFAGHVVINYYPWFPQESNRLVATTEIPVTVKASHYLELDEVLAIPDPEFWSWDRPYLYRVEILLQDQEGHPVDDFVTTTGIRTISQDGGTFQINGKDEMLNGAQIMGFRVPAEKIALQARCAPESWLARELLMIKKMNGNLLRMHVHTGKRLADGINDPRIVEMCDQLGIMCIWTTAAWIRTEQAWNLDFEGYPRYMKQVYNHPSIVMWEASNHPSSFRQYGPSESNLFYQKVYQTIYPLDQSRLISPTSHIGHTHFTSDQGGDQAASEYTAPMVTRGNQDAITGYGAPWSSLRTLSANSFLNSPDRAYFNFEHEESIGQPNWWLARGKPWYQQQSYEWGYDEGSIGRKLQVDEWRESQAWQAFSAWESMKKQRMLGYDGFSWCCLHGGPNMGTYKKPLIDCLGHAKLAFYTNRMLFQRVVAGSDNVDVVYGPADTLRPLIMNLDEEKTVDLEIEVRDETGKYIHRERFAKVNLPAGRTNTFLPAFKPQWPAEGYYSIVYKVIDATSP